MGNRAWQTITSTIVAITCMMGGSPANASPVYKEVGKNGTVTYSSVPSKAGSTPISLPPIMRGEHKLPEKQLYTCRTHAGVDCGAGADEDGSVICSDGFRDSAQRFNFSCSAAKLKVNQISMPDRTGSFSVFVRNERSLAAQETVVAVKFPDGKEHILEGPKEIDPFGVAEYSYRPANDVEQRGAAGPGHAPFRPASQHVKIICSNCS